MPINLSNVRNDKRTVSGEYFGDTFQVTYRPSEYTLSVESAMQNPQASQGADETTTANTVLVELFCKMIVSWDVLGDDGDPLPIEPDIVKVLPTALLGAIMQACREDMAPKVKSVRR